MKINLLDRSQASSRADGQYNHPDEVDEAFSNEYRQMVLMLSESLAEIGTVSVDGESTAFDFLLSTEDVYTRSIFVVCFHPRVFSGSMIDILQQCLQRMGERYLIVVDGWFSRQDRFYLFVEVDKVEGWFENPSRITDFG